MTGYIEVHSAQTQPEHAVPLKRSSGVFFPGRMLHRSGNNHTSRWRRAYVLHYGDMAIPAPAGSGRTIRATRFYGLPGRSIRAGCEPSALPRLDSRWATH
jgi:hypothetical protein